MRSRPKPLKLMKNAGRELSATQSFPVLQQVHFRMEQGTILCCIILVSSLALVHSLPSSLIEEIKANEFRDNKVKRAHPDPQNTEENRDIPYYNKPTAIKRGTNLKSPNADQQSLSDWEQEQAALYQNQNNLANIQSSLYNSAGENSFGDDKTIAEYEKGFQYGINKDKLDEALENAVLKSELYGDQAAINQYRYYGNDDRKRKRRDVRKLRLKREVDLTPEEILAILSLYENNRREQGSENYRSPWYRFDTNQNQEQDEENASQDDENWLSNPVFPHANNHVGANDLGNYFRDENELKHSKWGGFSDDRKKRFMVSKKRTLDPTRELRYLNGPNKNDFYTLSQLLSNQREPNVPLYHRLVL